MGRFDQDSKAPRRAATPVRAGLVLSTVLVVAGVMGGTDGGTAGAAPARSSRNQAIVSDPIAGHTYRHGAVPLRTSASPFGAAAGTHTQTTRRAAEPGVKGVVTFGGGPVVTGSPKVYVIFWGSQWGTQSTNGQGYDVYSGDPDGLAQNLQALFSGLGTDNEQWSAIVTQYCQGVAAGATTCPLSPASDHVAYPTSDVLAGVWEDTSAGLTASTGTQIAQEAANAAVHFSNPPGAQYVIVSPSRTDPDGWLDPRFGYCAYHDNTGDPSLGMVTGPDVPYTNMPYVPDVGSECSSYAHPGILDGADETATHEYAETLTDPIPPSGWTDHRANEVADKCENLTGGTTGATRFVTLATGTFAMQGIWANDLGKRGGCENAHSLILMFDPGKQKGTTGTALTLQIGALDLRGQTLHYAATGLPTGVVINPATGLLSGSPVARGRFDTIVTVSDTSASSAVGFVWTIRR